jgi:hypothetical protein
MHYEHLWIDWDGEKSLVCGAAPPKEQVECEVVYSDETALIIWEPRN